MEHSKYVVNFGTSAGSSARPPLGYPTEGYPSHHPFGGGAAPSTNCPAPGIQPIDPYPPVCPPPVAEGGGVNARPPPPSFTAYGRVSVLDEKYITALSNVNLIVNENLIGGGYTVKDASGNLMFQVKGKFRSLHKRRTIYDDQENPIVNMKKKIKTAHGRWFVYRGTSKDEKDLVFMVRKSHMIQHKTKLHVFLKGNDTEEACDFRVESFKKNCTVYVKDTDIIIAQMHIEDRVGRKLFGIDRFAVTVYPSVDQAFITALIVLFDEID